MEGCLGGAMLALAVTLAPQPCSAYDVMLRWTVSPNVTGYRVHAGSRSSVYDQHTDVGLLAASALNGVVYYLFRGVPQGTAEYVAITAYNTVGESAYSNEKVLNYATVTPPQVNAGPDQSAPVGVSLTLGSKAQDGVSYFWEQVDGPPATLSSRTTSSTHFSAGTAGTFTFAVTAYNAQGLAARDTVNVTQVGSGLPSPTSSPSTPSTPTPSTPTPTPIATSQLIRGNRSAPKTDRSGCQVEWIVVNANALDRYGLPSMKQACVDGDPSCDFDPETPGVCQFHVRVCLNNVDAGLPACAPNGVGTVGVRAPRLRPVLTTDSDAILAADLDALQNALGHLQDANNPAAGYRYAPPLNSAQQGFCSAPFAITAMVSARSSRASVTLKTRSTDDSNPRRHISVSQLQLTCSPATQ